MFTKSHHHYLMLKTSCFYHGEVFSENSVTQLLIQTAEQKLSLERPLSCLGNNKIIPTETKVKASSSLKKRPPTEDSAQILCHSRNSSVLGQTGARRSATAGGLILTTAGGICSMNSNWKTGQESRPTLFPGTSTQEDALKGQGIYWLRNNYFTLMN